MRGGENQTEGIQTRWLARHNGKRGKREMTKMGGRTSNRELPAKRGEVEKEVREKKKRRREASRNRTQRSETVAWGTCNQEKLLKKVTKGEGTLVEY